MAILNPLDECIRIGMHVRSIHGHGTGVVVDIAEDDYCDILTVEMDIPHKNGKYALVHADEVVPMRLH
jgi:hypothetical protein